MKTKRLFASILLTTMALLLTPRAAFANSAPKIWEGSDAYGSVTADKNCPITVESELLTFDIPDFPQRSGKNDEYKASVTAEYTFFNPTDKAITARLEFPFGAAPDYDYDSGDLTKYDITVNGAAIEKTVRHTLMGRYRHDFNLTRDLAKITDGFTEDDFFTPEQPVTKYVYEVVDYDENNKYACAAFDFYASRDIKVSLDGMSNCLSLPGGYRLAKVIKSSGLTLTVYVFGKQLDAPPEWTFYTDVSCSETADGKTTLKSAETMTFRELAMSIYPKNSEPLEADWYNAVVDDLNMNSEESYNCVIDHARVFNTKWAGLMRWYEYEITIPPHERIVNTVTAPIYPTIDENTNPAFFRYIYLLSPAQSWADFGSLEVVVNTPYYLIKNGYSKNDDSFEKTETGYKATFDGLPEGELRFSLSTDKNPRQINTGAVILNLLAFGALGALAIVIAIIAGVVVLIVALTRRKKR